MKRTWCALAILITGIALSPEAGWSQPDQNQAPAPQERSHDRWRFSISYWTAAYDGNFKLADQDILGGTATIKGDNLNLENDLGLKNPQGVPEFSAWVRLGRRHRIILSYFFADYKGSKRLTQNVDFWGYTFQINSDLDTEFRFSRTLLMYQYNPLLNDRGRVGLMAGMEYYLWRASYEGQEETTGARVSDALTLPLPVPVLGIEGELNLGYGFGVCGTFSGMGIRLSVMDVQASYTDLDAQLTYNYKMLHLGAGYRTINTIFKGKGDGHEDFDINFSHAGWIITAGITL
jgi:hypothetical protein